MADLRSSLHRDQGSISYWKDNWGAKSRTDNWQSAFDGEEEVKTNYAQWGAPKDNRWNPSHQGRMDAAMDFLSSGRIGGSAVYHGGGSYSSCVDSNECAVGWSCIGGRCEPPSETGGNIQPSSTSGGTAYGSSSSSCPTDDDNIPKPDTNDCGGGGGDGSGGCDKPGCGGNNGDEGRDCCGERCCRFFGTGVGLAVQCFCGPCPPPKRCQKWCDSFKKVNGRDAEGCSDATSCSECEECVTAHGGTVAECTPIQSGGPCHCGGSNACRGPCEGCQSDGTCKEDCNNCITCITMYNTDCGCGYGTIRCCTSACNAGSLSWAGCKNRGCASICPPTDPPEPDECEGDCYTRTHCTEGGPPDCLIPPCPTPPDNPPCPPQSSCTNLGFISAGGETCYLEKVCDKSNVPDTCGDCDCNCEDDCPDCEYCDSNGTCQPDPDCCDPEDEYHLYKRTWRRATTVTQSWSWGPLACDNEPPGYFTSGEPCQLKCRTQEYEYEESTTYLCYKRSLGVHVKSQPYNYTGYDGVGCCKDNEGTEYYLADKDGNRISLSGVYINGGSSATGGGLQNNCYNGGYHSFELVDSKCNICPDAPS